MVRAALALVLVAATPASPAAGDVAFPDGEWVGQPAVWKGAVSRQDVFGKALATAKFELTVEEGKVTGGTMTIAGDVSSEVPGPPPVTVAGKASGAYELAGTATRVKMSGRVQFRLKAKTPYGTFPFNFSASGDAGGFEPTSATCNKATGDLATETEATATAQGLNANITASFVALRVGTTQPTALLNDYTKLIEDIGEFSIAAEKTVIEVLALVQRIDELNARILGLGPCQPVPKSPGGFTIDGILAESLQGLLGEVIASAGEFTAQELLTLLHVGRRVGAVGLAVPKSSGVKEEAEELFTGFEAALSQKVDQAKAQGDTATITDILIAAQQYGMDPLADHAQGALATV